MGLESLPRGKGEESFSIKTERQRYNHATKAREVFLKAVRIASLGFALQSVPGMAAELGSPTPEEQKQVDQMLEASSSTGSIEIASHKIIKIPLSGGEFSNVTVYGPRGELPKRVMLLFKQNHLHSAEQLAPLGLTEPEKLGQLERVELSQAHIYKELVVLKEQGVITSACEEGLTAEHTQSYASNLKDSFGLSTVMAVTDYDPHTSEVFKRFAALMAKPSVSSEEAREMQGKIFPYFEEVVTRYPHVLGGATRLAFDGGITLCGAEEQHTYDAADSPHINEMSARFSRREALSAGELSELRMVVYRDREMAALHEAEKQPGDAVALDYGAAHQFTATVAKWNIEHPQEQIALVQINAYVGRATDENKQK